MQRLLGTVFACCLVVTALGSSDALASDSHQKYGFELRGGFGMYDMGDVTTGIETMDAHLRDANISRTLNKQDQGPAAGLSFLYRPSRHTMWEVGYNALMDVENKVDSNPDTASGQILMHANEFFLKGIVVATLTDRIHLDFGAGVSYYVSELQIQDNFRRRFDYDADGRAFGLIGTVGLEILLTQRLGLIAEVGSRVANTSHFTREEATSVGTRTGVNVIDGERPIEVNLSGAFAGAGLRFYFDPVTKPVDFTR
jgi:hypothetical protein